MKSKYERHALKRTCAASVIVALQLQGMSVAYATVSQLPALYTTPPDSNVMFTLDDSGSMKADAIPDFDSSDSDLAGAGVNDAASNYMQSFVGTQYPNMWGSGSKYLSVNLYKSTSAVARYMRSSAGNPLYYDRTVTYKPWPLATDDKSFMPLAVTTKVNIHPDNPTITTRQLDLTKRVNVTGSPTPATACDNESNNYWPATYYVYKGPAALPNAKITSTNNTAANFDKIEIKPKNTSSTSCSNNTDKTFFKAATRTDCVANANSCSYAEELQNFANWLQYYRSRLLMAKGGVATAFAKQGTNLRVGLGSLNDDSGKTIKRGVAAFLNGVLNGVTVSNRTNFYTDLYSIDSGGTSSDIHLTPLRKAMDDVGKYFQKTGIGNPWAQDPTSTTSVGTEFTCRRSFHILSTDGFWNSTGATSPASSNNDSFSGNTPSKPDGTFYTFSNTATSSTDPLVARFGINPFKDNNSSTGNTLADVAAYYWKTDLRADAAMVNNVASSSRDPAFWQHLTTFTVGLGINGTGTVTKTVGGVTSAADISTQAARDLLVNNRVQLNWTNPGSGDNPQTGDDLIHASMNGHGRYFSATNPTEMANGLAGALAEVADVPLDLSAVAADSPQVAANGVIYQGTFSPQNWYGRVYAFQQNAITGVVSTNPATALWEASNKMPAPDARNIFTIDTSLAVPTGSLFTIAATGGLNATQKSYLGSDATSQQNMVDYLRGKDTKEVAKGGTFRDRTRNTVNGVTGGVLGDIVNGAPIKGPDAGGSYDRLPSATEAAAYTTFRSGTTLDAMRATLFVGANDGMLHAFNTADGVERFAYVPNAVFNMPPANGSPTDPAARLLRSIADVTYPHFFTVDGPPNLGDAFIGGQWKTLLVSSAGAGARAVFAMDVTNPVVGASGFSTGKILWEFSQENNPDMGLVLGYPHVVRMRDGSWAVVFGNGYDSKNGQAKLFILNAANGAVIREFAVGSAGSNGLSMPNFVLNDKREVVALYAGDLQGNLWKFDVSGTTSASWNVAFSSQPLFSVGPTQPITVMPEITAHPNGGALVSFGTGKLFETSDTATSSNVNLNTQGVYSIWDKPLETTGIGSSLTSLQFRVAPATPAAPSPAPAAGEFQAMSSTDPSNSAAIDWTTKRGWYFNLSTGGERVNVNPQQFQGAVFMIANTPNTADPCALGGLARVFAVDPTTGVAPTFPVFDVNGDSTFTSADIGNIFVNRKGVLTQPLFQLPPIAGFSVTPAASVSPLAIFDRGQASGARTGGVELTKSFGGSLATGTPCSGVMSAGRSDTSVLNLAVNCPPPAAPPPCTTGCGSTKRISWKQLL